MSNLPSRKRPHSPDRSPNESGGDGSKVKVVVRIRPPNAKESEGNFRIVVQAVDENILVFDPKENNGHEVGRIKGRRDIRKRPNRDLKFAFDRVFGPETSNEEVYKETTNLVISGVLDGYNCSVFAYGATGAGKTFTMLGTKEKPGVMYHTMVDLYARIESIKDNTTCNIAVSYLEVYNETLRDLLMPGNPLPIREDPGKGVVIPGLSLHKPKNAEELLYMLQFGNQHRSQHPTDANAESSRSHAVFQVFVRQQDRTANISTEVRVAKMCLVDLAGSERATVNKNSGSRFREGANINRSLLALGNVINALAENKNKGFVPYRDSKLTRLLKDSLGGNCQTVMIAAVSPSSMSFEDTYNTLQYADRAKHIRATLKKNVLNVDFHMAKYGQIVTELRKEISELKSKLKGYEEGTTRPLSAPSSSVPPPSVGPGMSSSFVGYQRELDVFFTSHLASRSDQLKQEIALRNLQWKLYRKNRSVARVKALGNMDEQARLGNVVKNMAAKSSCLSISVDNSRGKLEQELSRFKDISQSLKQVGGVDSLPEVLGLSLQAHRYGLELEDTKQYLEFTKQVIRCQERELHHNERLVLQLLKLLRNQHFIIKGHNIITSDLEGEYTDIVKKVIGQELTWEDELDEDQLRGYHLSDMLDLPTLKMKLSPTDLNWKTSHTVRKERNTGGANKQTIWPAKLSTDKPLPCNQDDECFPTKAKRAMLTPSVQQQQVRHDTGKHRRRPPHGNKSKFSSAARLGHSRSLSESNLKRNVQNDAGKRERSSFLPSNMPSRVLQTSSSIDDVSPECDVQMNTRFAKINDTITKAKKFSHLHTKDVTKEKTLLTQSCEMNGDNSESLDGTFTIDETESVVPISIPCIDTEIASECISCSRGVSQSDRQVNLGSMCINCELQRKNGTKINNDGHTLGLSASNTDCDRDKVPGSNQDDSNASTLVNQSASSQTSLASTSTLVADLSQNLSGEIDTSAIENRNTYGSVNTKENRQQGLRSGEGAMSKDRPSDSGAKLSGFGETVTKTNLYKIIEERSMEKSIPGSHDSTGKHTKAARCINFGDSKEKDCCRTAVINTKTPDRRPLQDVGDSNTPHTDRNSFGCLTSSTDSDLSLEKSLHKQKMSGTRLFEKENCKLLSKFGLPSMTEGSLIINSSGKGKSKMNHSTTTPGYMQLTKAHSHRIKHNKSVNSESENGPGRVKSTNIQRPLLSQMRSKSMSNLSSRSGWQF